MVTELVTLTYPVTEICHSSKIYVFLNNFLHFVIVINTTVLDK